MSSGDEQEGGSLAKKKKFVELRSTGEPEEDVFGPSLPPHLLEKKHSECRSQQKIYGPVLPDDVRTANNKKNYTLTDDVPSTSGSGQMTMIGPEIPEYLKARMRQKEIEENEEEEVEDSECSDEKEGDDEMFGPSPALMTSEMAPCSSHKAAFEKKKISRTLEDLKEKKRESWMLELPENKTDIFALGPRKFRTNILSGKESDRSVWTETPQDKIKGKPDKKEKNYSQLLQAQMLDERNKEMEKLAKSASKSKHRKKESLMEMHTKKMKKKKKKAEKEKDKKPERRPFDRNVDLQIRRIDENQRKSILNKAAFLNSRFASGESKYL